MKTIISTTLVFVSMNAWAQTEPTPPAQAPVPVQEAPSANSSPAPKRNSYVWAGFGFNYVSMKQDIDSILSHVDFESFRAPSFYVEASTPLGENWDLIASYKKSPGAVGSPEGFTVQNGNYSWDILTLEGQYSKPSWQPTIAERPAKFYLRFGVNQNTVPFWERTSVNTVDIKTNQILMTSVGGQLDCELTEEWVLSTLLRYHYPVSTGSFGKIDSKLSFDGSIGAYYKLNEQWNLGGFWYGRYHSWDFKHTDAVLNAEVSGRQQLLFSNMEIRLGYGF